MLAAEVTPEGSVIGGGGRTKVLRLGPFCSSSGETRRE